MRFFVFNIICINLFIFINCKKVLVTYAHDEKSHIYSMMFYIKALQSLNYEIILFESGNFTTPTNLGSNSTTILCQTPKNLEMFEGFDDMIWRSSFYSVALPYVTHFIDDDVVNMMSICSKQISQVLSHKYDLIIIDELFNVHGYIFTHLLNKLKNIPYIVFGTSHISPDWSLSNLAMGQHSVLYPIHGTKFQLNSEDNYDHQNFYHRLINTVEATAELIGYELLHSFVKSPELFGIENYSPLDIIRNSEIQISEMIDTFGRIVPISSDFRSIGSYCTSPPDTAKELPTEFDDFINDPKSKGTIYIAFGSLVNFQKCPTKLFEAFFEALNEFEDYKIIFSLKNPGRELPKIKKHIKITPWAPQYAILNHPKTKFFVTHGGLKSFKETLCAETPVIVMPLFAEQVVTAYIALKYKSGRVLNKFYVTKNQIIEEFNSILNDNAYKKNAIKMKEFFLDRPISSYDEAKFITKKIITKQNDRRNPLYGNKRKGIDLTWMEYFNIDLFIAIASIIWVISK